MLETSRRNSLDTELQLAENQPGLSLLQESISTKGDDTDVMFTGDTLSTSLQSSPEVQVPPTSLETEETPHRVSPDSLPTQGETQPTCLDVIVPEDCLCQDISPDAVTGPVEILSADAKTRNMDGRSQDSPGQSEEILRLTESDSVLADDILSSRVSVGSSLPELGQELHNEPFLEDHHSHRQLEKNLEAVETLNQLCRHHQ